MKKVFLSFLLTSLVVIAFAQNKTRYVTAAGLNVRETESTSARVVASLKMGDAVELLGYKSAPTVVNGNKGSWVQVSVGKVRGYVFDFHLSETKPTASGFPAVFKPTKVYKMDKADLHESLKVQYLGNGKIAYEVYMVNGGCEEFVFRGVAIEKKGDMESDTDAEGNGFAVAEYNDTENSKCGVQIRIGADKGYTKHARFIIFDCDKTPHCKEKEASESLLIQ